METIFASGSLHIYALLFATPWILLALLATFGDACVGYIDELLLRRLAKRNTTSTIEIDAPGRLLLISGFFGFVTCLCAFFASLFLGPDYTLHVPLQSLFLAISAGILEVTWMIPYFIALERGGAINTTPLFQTIPIFSLFFGLTIFNEIPTTLHIVATLLIIAGAVALNYSPETKRMNVVTLNLMLLASAIISIGFFLFKDASVQGNVVASLFGNGLGMGLFSSLIWTIWPPYRKQFNDFLHTLNPRILAIQVSNEGLYALSTTASQMAIVFGPSVMVVTAFNAFHPIFTLLIGVFLAKLGSQEHMQNLAHGQLLVKTAAVLCIAVGAFLIVV